MKKVIIIFAILVLTINTAVAKHIQPEKYYQELWCNQQKGVSEYRLKDYTRVDCLTTTHAVEFDFAKKWAEAIGQSLHYADMTGKKAGIVLILESPADIKYYDRIKNLCKKYNITLWEMKSPDYCTK